jgi:DNA primase
MDTVNEVKTRADIVELIGQYTVLTRSGKSLKGLCPFHSEKHGSFFVYPETGTWHCFGACATGGDVFSFIMKKEGLTFSEALERLAEKYGIVLPARFAPSPETDHRSDLYALNAAAARYFHDLLLTLPEGASARAYLNKRGVSAKSIADFQIGYARPEWQAIKDNFNAAGHSDDVLLEDGLIIRSESGRLYDRFRDQIIFPIADARGRITGFGARVLNDTQPKYLNSPETPLFSKSSALYGINLASAAIRQADAAVIVEGYFDVIISHQYGFSNTVASMGTAINEKHLTILKKLSPNLILALDADAAGAEATTRCVPFENLLEKEIKVAVAPPGKDPDEVIIHSAEDWRGVLNNSSPITDFIFERFSLALDLRTAAGKAELAGKMLPLIADIKDSVRRGHYLAKLAGVVGSSSTEMHYRLSQLKLPQVAVKPGGLVTANKSAPATAGSVEDYLLALLLRNPDLRAQCRDLRSEYFSNIENREIFRACQTCAAGDLGRELLDPALWEHFDRLMGSSTADGRLEERLNTCARRLEKAYLRNTLTKYREMQSLEKDEGSAGQILAHSEQILAIARRLAELDRQGDEPRRTHRR